MGIIKRPDVGEIKDSVRWNVEELCDYIHHLETENAELQKDRERLEKLERWLAEGRHVHVTRKIIPLPGEHRGFFHLPEGVGVSEGGFIMSEGSTLNEAIDNLEE